MADPDVWIGPDHLRFGRVRESDPLLKKELLTLEKDSVHQTIGKRSSSYPHVLLLVHANLGTRMTLGSSTGSWGLVNMRQLAKHKRHISCTRSMAISSFQAWPRCQLGGAYCPSF